MKRIRVISLLSVFLLSLYGLFHLSIYLQKKNVWILEGFTGISRTLYISASLIIFLGLVFWGAISTSVTNVIQKRLSITWFTGFLVGVAIALGMVYYVNPHARFARDLFPSITPSARSIKTGLYVQQTDEPDIVILGSSRAFTLSPRYIEEKTAHKAFNMSVEAGRTGDYAVQLNFMLKLNFIPDALIVDISYETLAADYMNAELQPLALIRYMPPKMAYAVLDESLRDVFSVQSLSDSAYLLMLPNVEKRPRGWSFEGDGMGIRSPLSHEQYITLLSSTIENRLDGLFCKRIDSQAKEMLEATIDLAMSNNIAVILYESPLHATFSETAIRKNANGYESCRKLIGNYLSSLAQSHPNVFFKDLSEYNIVSALKEEGFYDAVHLRPGAAELVVDALIPEIENALTWSQQASAK